MPTTSSISLSLLDESYVASAHFRSPQLDSSILSRVADSLSGSHSLYLNSGRVSLDGIGSRLERGCICLKGLAATQTASGMTGGRLCIRGDVRQVSNVLGGFIFIDGNIESLVNIHTNARLYCTGRVGRHLFDAPGFPSAHIYCHSAPFNDVSYSPAEYRRLRATQRGVLISHRIVRSGPLLTYDALDDPRMSLNKSLIRQLRSRSQ